MTESTGFASVPDPEQNRAEYAADHPGAAPVSQDEAAAAVAAQLGTAAPPAGVSGDQLGQQMADAGAAAGLPYEDVMNTLMKQVQQQAAQIRGLQQRDQQREQATIAALGEPILQRYANGVRDKLAATVAANPGSSEHFAQAVADAGQLADASAHAIARGANDLGTVRAFVARLDRFLTLGHARTATGHYRHVDLSSVAHDLEQVNTEADRLEPGPPPGRVVQGQLTGSRF